MVSLKLGRRISFTGLKRNVRLYVKSKIGVVGLGIILFFIILAIFAPELGPHNPVFGTNVAAPYSVPAWATLLPEYNHLAVTSYLVAPTGFGSQSDLSAWTLQGVPNGKYNYSISPVVPPPSKTSLPANPKGTLMVNASIVPVNLTSTNPYLPGGQVFFSMTQKFQYSSLVPSAFLVNSTIEAVKMSNVSNVYLNYIISTPTNNFTISTVETYVLAPEARITPQEQGAWMTSSIPSALLGVSNITQFEGVIYPSQTIFGHSGTYSLTLQIQAVPSGSDPFISLRVSSVSFRILGGAYGILGTDDYGRDVWSQFVWGSRISLLIGILSGVGAVGLGTLLGLAAGYIGGFTDEILGRITDFVLVLPFLPLLIILTLILTQNAFLVKTIYTWVIVIFVILSWPTITKIVRSQVLTVKERPYVEASRALGGGTGHILRKHILPNVTGLVYSQVALNVSGFILLEAALDFLSVSVYPTGVMSWGIMLTQSLPDAISDSAQSYVWWWFIPPGIAIALLSLAFVLVGFALDQVFNPRLRAR